ncbi:MAG TPA: hypothetical protein VNK50_12575 [Calidithermus sp.]|nr:hypothetical protein [Calidithermus sp.]
MGRTRTIAGFVAAFSSALVIWAAPGYGLTLGADFAADYTVTSLGSVPGVPINYGGLTFLDNDTILIGGAANSSDGRIYQIDVVRGAGNHITGFSGTASLFGGPGSGIGEFNDGGVVFGPGGVLFLARWPVNQIGQVKPGSTDEDKIVPGPSGAASSVSALNFVPTGFSGAGDIKIVTYSAGQWFDATLTPDGTGTFNITNYVQVDLDPVASGIQNVPGGPEGFVYIAAGNPGFGVPSMLISEYAEGEVGAYELDSDGNPLVSTRRTFLSGLSGAEGAAIDPLTGDYLFSTFGGGNQVVVVQGFLPPQPPPAGVASPSTLLLVGLGLTALAAQLRNRP